MRFCVILIAALLVMATGSIAEEIGCPADRAALAGFEVFGEFHHVMAQTWHVDWPDSNFQALFAAGPEFSRLFKPIAMLKPKFKTDGRRGAFLDHRRQFGQIVKKYNAACTGKDSASVYRMMPGLHDAFEAAAGDLLPIPYPELDGLVITSNLISETHLPRKNMDGLVGSTETLVTKAKYLTKETIPPELEDIEDKVLAMHEAIRKLASLLPDQLASGDLTEYQKTLTELQQVINGFQSKYM